MGPAAGTNAYGLQSQQFVKVLGDIVQKVSDVVTPQLTVYDPTIVGVNYLYGPFKEIVKVLGEWNGTSFANKKYPLIALLQPFDEVKGGRPDLDSVDRVRIIIARQSDPKWLTAYRYEKNFIPVLYPIYDELIKQLAYNKLTASQVNKIPHTKIDWPYWDNGQDNNPFNDWLDIIEIKDMKLNIRNTRC